MHIEEPLAIYLQAFNREFASAGHPVKIVAIGGSVTLGHGVGSDRNSYVNQFFDWIRQAFPNERHELLNHAVPAVRHPIHLSKPNY